MDVLAPYLTKGFFREVLLAIHMLAVVFGMGSAYFLQYLFFRKVRSRVEESHIELFEIASHIIKFALVFMFVTGVGFLILYANMDPSKLNNAKIYGKIMVVSILCINGLAMHEPAKAVLHAHIGRPFLEDLTLQQMRYFLFKGTMSFVFWMTAFLLGVFRTMNNLYGMYFYIGSIIALMLIIKTTTYLMAPFLMPKRDDRELLPQRDKKN